MAEVEANNVVIQAIDTIVQQRISGLDYDRTIICTIADDSDSINGHYIVDDGSISFDAYSENSGYVVDDNVYVTIPKGDFTQKKLIISKYTADNNIDPISYKSPLANMFIISKNLVQNIHDNGIVANGRLEKRAGETVAPGQWRKIWEYDFTKDSNASIRNNAMFDSLGIKASFKCGLGTTYQMKSGHYGLVVEIYSTSNADSLIKGGQSTRTTFDTSEMFGNPYMFLTFFPQEKLINIGNLGDITKINIYLFQSSDFYYTTESDIGEIVDVLVPSTITYFPDLSQTRTAEKELEANIFVDNLEVYFGMNLNSVADNTFQIYSASSSGFNMETAETNPSYNEKEIIPVWFNKDAANNYLGFSDGIYSYYDFQDIDSSEEPVGREYDERKYLKKDAYINRGAKLNQTDLTNQGIPSIQELLQIYSYGQEIDTYWRELFTQMNNKMYKVLISSRTDLRANQSTEQQRNSAELLADLLGNVQGHPGNSDYLDAGRNFSEFIENEYWMTNVLDILKDYGDWYSGGTSVNPQTALSTLYSLYVARKNEFDRYHEAIEDYFVSLKEQVDKDIYVVWDVWYESAEKIFTNCYEIFDKILNLISLSPTPGTLINSSSSANDKYMDCISWQLSRVTTNFGYGNFESYEVVRQNFINSYANRYSIFWYRFKAGYKNEEEQFLNSNWELIEDKVNCGLPAQGSYEERDDRNLYWIKSPDDSNSTVTISVGDKSLPQEFIRAVLVYNHEVFISNTLTFTNENPVVDETTADSVKGLYIAITDEEYYTDKFDDQGNPLQKHEDTYNNKEVYQLYGVTGYLVNQAERYKRRTLRARFNGSKRGDDFLAKGCTVYWYIPLNATMLDVKRDELIDAGFSYYDPEYVRGTDELEKQIQQLRATEESEVWTDEELAAHIQELKDNFQNGKYSIPPTPYGNNYKDGYIMVWKNILSDDNGHVDVQSTEFFYQIKDYYVPSFTNNTIICRVVKDGQYVYEAEQAFTFASFGTNGTDYSLCIVPATNQAALRDDSALALKVAVYDVNGKIMEEETNNIQVSWTQREGGAIFGGVAPDIIVSRVHSDQPFGYNVLKAEVDVVIKSYEEIDRDDSILVEGITTNNQSRNKLDENENVKERVVTLTAFYPIPWACDDLYAEGPNIIVYDSLGSNPSYYNGPYRLFYGSTKEKAHQLYEVSNAAYVVGAQVKPYCTGENTNRTTLIRECLPKIKIIEANNDAKAPAKNMTNALMLSVPSLYLEDNDFYAKAIITEVNANDEIGKILYVQPIVMMQNRFSSPMLNNWDGELTIDEKNGTILATMVGAGKKEKDNTFSGVLMGDVAATTEDTAAGMGTQGIYGYNHGEQAFAFKNDGTGFIGKNGKGRIMFDGNKSTIQSMSYAQTQTGMKLDLDDGFIDMRGAYVDYENQSDNWKLAAEAHILQDEESIRYTVDPNEFIQGEEESDEDFEARKELAKQVLNNNEINGYENTTKYTPTGSQVTISTRTPFFKIVSPSVYNTTESSYDSAIKKFWEDKFYVEENSDYEDEIILDPEDPESEEELLLARKRSITEYLNNAWDLHEPAACRCTYYGYVPLEYVGQVFTGESVIGSGGTAPAIAPGTIVYRKVLQNIVKSLISPYMLIDLTGYPEPEKLYKEDNNGETVEIDPVVFYEGDYIRCLYGTRNNVTQIVEKYYIPKEEADQMDIAHYPDEYHYNDGCVVDSKNVLVSQITDSFGQTLNVDNLSLEDIVNNIYEASVEPEDLQDLAALKANWKFKFLSVSDREQGEHLYLNIIDNKRFKESKTLMNVATNEYYFQTDNYTKGSLNDIPWPYATGKGLKFDLMKGSLDAYNFNLVAANPNEGSYVKINSSGNPYFQVSYRGKNRNRLETSAVDLIKITSGDYILQSQNWYNKGTLAQNSGTKFDLKNGRLTSYNFDLVAYDKSNDYIGSYVRLSSHGNPYFSVHYKGPLNENELDVLKISRSQFVMRSQDWQEEVISDDPAVAKPGKGITFDLSQGRLYSYNFDLLAKNSLIQGNNARYNGSFVKMKSNGEPFFQVHLKDNEWTEDRAILDEDNGVFAEVTVNAFGEPAVLGVNTTVEADLIKLTNSEFIIQSANFSDEHNSGFKLDINKGALTGYNTKIKLIGATTNISKNIDNFSIASHRIGTLLIDPSDANIPFSVKSADDQSAFKIHWDGSIEANYGFIGGWNINSNSIWTNGTTATNEPNDTTSFRLSAENFYRQIGNGADDFFWIEDAADKMQQLRIAIGTQFGVAEDGTVFAKNGAFAGQIDALKGTIGGWIIDDGVLKSSGNENIVLDGVNGSITGTTINVGNGTFVVNANGALTSSSITVTGGSISINGGVFSVDSNGNLSASSVTISGSGEGTSFNLNSSGYLQASGASISGNVNIYGGSISISGSNGNVFEVDSNGKLTANSATISGKVTAKTFVWGDTDQTMLLCQQIVVSDLTGVRLFGDYARYPKADGIVTSVTPSYSAATVYDTTGNEITITYVDGISVGKGAANSSAGWRDLLYGISTYVDGKKTTYSYVGLSGTTTQTENNWAWDSTTGERSN